MVPVNLRPLDEAWKLGNRFGLAPLVLPIGIENPVGARLCRARAHDALKASYQPLLAFAVLAVAGQLAKPIQDMILGLFAKKSTAVMTNVPGPGVPLHFCGSTLKPDDVLGAGLGRHRRRRQHPLVRRRRAVRPDHRRGALPGSAGHRRPLRAGVREAAAGSR